MDRSKVAVLLAASCVAAGAAMAQDYYVSGSIGLNQQNDSDNSGTTGAFTTGNLGDDTTLDVAAGTPYGWSTEFDQGLNLSAEFGQRLPNGFRIGGELTYSQSDVDTHTGVTLDGGSIDALDAATLTGDTEPLGLTIGDVVADGQGDITQTALFANVYYDFNRDAQLQPYVGGGLGFADVDVSYNPSGVGIIDDSQTKFAYQFKVGATYMLQNQWEVFGEYAYRATEDVEVDNELFPGSLDIENQQNVFSIGARYRFGG